MKRYKKPEEKYICYTNVGQSYEEILESFSTPKEKRVFFQP
jgi:hypothetical protein